jgi:(S)-mandelate dehydrogenase
MIELYRRNWSIGPVRLSLRRLILTVDNAVTPKREYNDLNGFGIPFKPCARSLLDMLGLPVWFTGVLMRYLMTTGIPRHENYPKRYQTRINMGVVSNNDLRNDSITWDDVRYLRDLWPGLLILKGIQRGDDAVRAVESGADAIIASNHGGRQLDSAQAPLEMLPEIVRAVGATTTVMLDGGIRRGSDVAKALALGAKAVLVGRATLYGVSVAGQAGAELSLAFLRDELDRTLAFVGCRCLDELNPSFPTGVKADSEQDGDSDPGAQPHGRYRTMGGPTALPL